MTINNRIAMELFKEQNKVYKLQNIIDVTWNNSITIPSGCTLIVEGGGFINSSNENVNINLNFARIVGTLNDLIHPSNTGVLLFNNIRPGTEKYEDNIKYTWNGTFWARSDGSSISANHNGTFVNKPSASDIYVGFGYFCTDKNTTEGTTDGIMIYHKGDNIWVDALGRVVS